MTKKVFFLARSGFKLKLVYDEVDEWVYDEVYD